MPDAEKDAPASTLMVTLFCNCCYDDCDCGCVEACRLVRHKTRVLPPEEGSNHG